MASHIHIDKCLTKYKELFTLKDNTQETSKSDIDKEICIKEKYNEFERLERQKNFKKVFLTNLIVNFIN